MFPLWFSSIDLTSYPRNLDVLHLKALAHLLDEHLNPKFKVRWNHFIYCMATFFWNKAFKLSKCFAFIASGHFSQAPPIFSFAKLRQLVWPPVLLIEESLNQVSFFLGAF